MSEGADEDSAEISLRLLPDPTTQDRIFAVHLSGVFPVPGLLACCKPTPLWL